MKPMLAVDAPKELHFPLYASPKLDGIRAVISDGKPMSRSFKILPNRHIQRVLSHPWLEGLDGELVVGEATHPNCMQVTTSGVMSYLGEPIFKYYVFDLWNHPNIPFEKRHKWLEHGFTEKPKELDNVILLEQVVINNNDELAQYETKCLATGYEGVILRKPDSIYKYGRSTQKQGYLLKLKRFSDGEANIIGFEELMHNANELGLNLNNVSAEFPKWRRARGLMKRITRHYLMDGTLYPYEESMDCLINSNVTNNFATKKKDLCGQYLVLMPCNSGAKVGNYFTKNTWRTASKYFPERMVTFDFAAVDSITTAIPNDGKGLIVFENEMDRVKGYDMFPTYSEEKKHLCKLKFEQSIPRLLIYEHIFVYLNVRLYDEVIRECALPNMTFFDLPYKQGPFLQHLPSLRKLIDVSLYRSI